jgi:hypothetical protein
VLNRPPAITGQQQPFQPRKSPEPRH